MDFEKTRKNMLDCQLLTNGITDERVQAAFMATPREVFLPEEKRGFAYIDEDIALDEGAFLMEPMTHARLVQYAGLSADDVVLNIGDFTGYASAILSQLVSTVITLEPKAGMLDHARQVWSDLGCCNVALVNGSTHVASEGVPEHAPYSVIMVHGATCDISDSLLDQLQDGGRLIAVECAGENMPGNITIVEKVADGKYSRRTVKNASVPFVPGMEPKPGFVF
jgi:protein-L-isoaspartate(D-aspartate) O-methyltransferase